MIIIYFSGPPPTLRDHFSHIALLLFDKSRAALPSLRTRGKLFTDEDHREYTGITGKQRVNEICCTSLQRSIWHPPYRSIQQR